MVIKIEAKTRQFIGIVSIGGAIIAMIFVGLIPEKQYHPYVSLVLGAFFYHIVRMLNVKPDLSPDIGKMVGAPLLLPQLQNHIGDSTGMVNQQVKPVDPPQPIQEQH